MTDRKMSKEQDVRNITARRIRRIGLLSMCWAVALAALLDGWHASFLTGVFILGVGVGLGDWKWGD